MREEAAPQHLHILWKEILKRYPVIEVVGEAQRTYSNFIHGFSLDARANPGPLAALIGGTP
jgi:hypothetical protein